MRPIIYSYISCLTCLAAGWISPAVASSQSIWTADRHDKMISFEFLKPEFEKDGEFSRSGSAYFLSVRWPLSEKATFTGEIPFSHGSVDHTNWEKTSESAFGNPYLGVEVRGENPNLFWEFGLRPPMSPDDKDIASFTGLFSDFDRFAAFPPDWLTIKAMVHLQHQNAAGFSYRFHFGPIFMKRTKSDPFIDDQELLVAYSAHMLYRTEMVRAGGGLTGIAILSEDDLLLHGQATNQLGLAVDIGSKSIRPGILLRIPLDLDLATFINFVWGLNLTILL